jgi:hypothetical protein
LMLGLYYLLITTFFTITLTLTTLLEINCLIVSITPVIVLMIAFIAYSPLFELRHHSVNDD